MQVATTPYAYQLSRPGNLSVLFMLSDMRRRPPERQRRPRRQPQAATTTGDAAGRDDGPAAPQAQPKQGKGKSGG